MRSELFMVTWEALAVGEVLLFEIPSFPHIPALLVLYLL